MLNNEEKKSLYHLSCHYCNQDWVIDEIFPRYCPFCGRPYGEKNYLNCAFGQTTITNDNIFSCKKRKMCSSCDEWTVKDCTTCRHGFYNDRYDTYFCDGDLSGECKNWNLWEMYDVK